MSEEKGMVDSKLTGGHVVKGSAVIGLALLFIFAGIPLINFIRGSQERSEEEKKESQDEAVWKSSVNDAKRVTYENKDHLKEYRDETIALKSSVRDLQNFMANAKEEDSRLENSIKENTEWRIGQEKRATQRVKDQEFREKRLTKAEEIIEEMRKKHHVTDLQLLELDLILKQLSNRKARTVK